MKVKALIDFKYFNNSGHFEVKKNDVVEIESELAKDFIRHGFMEEVKFIVEIKPLIEVKEVKEVKADKDLPLVKIKKHKEGELSG
jgi:hypothetical protein